MASVNSFAWGILAVKSWFRKKKQIL